MHDLDVLKLDGRLLKLFLAVYDNGSVGVAAEVLELNQSTVSHGLDRLRNGLGDPLFVKSGRGITPTDFSILIAPNIREIVGLLEGLNQDTTFVPSKEETPITIAANISELITELKALRICVEQKAPSLRMRFIELGSRENIEPLLERGKADVVISARPTNYSRALCWTEFITDKNMCFFDPKHRRPIASLEDYSNAKHAVLDFGGSRMSNVEVMLERLAIDRTIHLSAPNTFCLGQLMAGTDCVATMQSRLSRSVLNHLAFCAPPFPLPEVRFDLVWHKRSDTSSRNQWIRDTLLTSRESPGLGA